MYKNKVTLSLAYIHNCKMAYYTGIKQSLFRDKKNRVCTMCEPARQRGTRGIISCCWNESFITLFIMRARVHALWILFVVGKQTYSISFRANEARFHVLHGSMRLKNPLLLSMYRKAYSMPLRANEARFHASADAFHGSIRRKKPLLLSLFRKAWSISFRANEARFHASADALHGSIRRKKPLLLSLFRKA